MPGVPGLFIPEQAAGWKRVVDAVHEKGGYIYFQIWHAGRATIPHMTGMPPVSASATPWDDPEECYTHSPVGMRISPRYADHPPIELSVPHIKKTIKDYCDAAETAMKIGFDGVEVHGGNGYLPEQFLSSNINKRTDEYGGSPEKRCKFVLELMDELAGRVGEENLAIRLTPFGLFNQARGEQRVETWTHLCKELKRGHPGLSYVNFVEPVSFLLSIRRCSMCGKIKFLAYLLSTSATNNSSALVKRINSSKAGVSLTSTLLSSALSSETLPSSQQEVGTTRTHGV